MLVLTPLDNVWVRVDCDDSIAAELNDYFSFDTPGAQFMRRQSRFKGWDGKVRLFKLGSRKIYRGLLPRVLEFAAQNEYDVTNNVPTPVNRWPDADLAAAITELNLPHVPDDYQLDGAATTCSTTSAASFRHRPAQASRSSSTCSCRGRCDLKTLIVVPTLGLVTQMVSDFESYGCKSRFTRFSAGPVEDEHHARITVSTWQSIVRP
jgi:hypothetical protein